MICKHLAVALLAAGVAAIAAPAQAQLFAPEGKTVAPLAAPGSSLYFVYANAVEGKDAEFGAWYDQHIRDLMKLPGFVRAQRFKMSPRKGKEDPPFKYLVVYEISGDPDTVLAALGPAVKEGRLQAPDKALVAGVQSSIYAPIEAKK